MKIFEDTIVPKKDVGKQYNELKDIFHQLIVGLGYAGLARASHSRPPEM